MVGVFQYGAVLFLMGFVLASMDATAQGEKAPGGEAKSFLSLKKKQADQSVKPTDATPSKDSAPVEPKKPRTERASKRKKSEHVYTPSQPTAVPVVKPVAPPPAEAAASTDGEDDTHLTGSWGGYRNKLADKGLSLDLIYKTEVDTVFAGGAEKNQSQYLANANLKLSMDFDKMLGWKGGSSFFYVVWNKEAHPSQRVGDAQGTTNIESPVSTAKLYEAWLQQTFADDKVSILAGLHDLNAEFYVTDTAGLFFNGSFGVGKELAQTGVNGPSVFPTTAPALRLKMEPSKSFYLQTAAFNAQSGDTNNPKGTHPRLNKNDGLLLVSEFAYVRGNEAEHQRKGKYAFGFWNYTRTFDHQEETVGTSAEPVQATNQGYYAMIDQGITDSLSAFVRYGYASPEVNRFSACTSAGFTLTGIIPHRAEDQFGFGATRADNGKTYKHSEKMAGNQVDDAETTLEVTYRIKVWSGVALQPDYQYVINPSTDPSLKNAEVGILRLDVAI